LREAATHVDPPASTLVSSEARVQVVVDVVVVLALTAAAAMHRAQGLGASSLSFEDTWLALVSRVETVQELLMVGVAAPGFALLARGWFDVFGFSTTTAQMMGFVPALLTIPVVYLVGRSMDLGVGPSSAPAALLAWSPIHIQQSVAFKQYSTDALLATVLVWLGYRLLTGQVSSRRWAVLLGVAVVATLISASIAVVAVSTLAACLVAASLDGRWRIGAVALGTYASLVGLWWLLVLRRNVTGTLSSFWEGHYLEDPAATAVEFSRGLTGLREPLIVGSLSAVLILGLIMAIRRDRGIALLLWGPALR